MDGPGDPDTVDELVVGPGARSGRTPRGAGAAARLATGWGWRLLGGVAALLLAVTLGPGLLSGPAPAPERQQREGVTARDARTAGEWTGPPERPTGNRFVQSPVRLLRLPA